MEQNDESKPNRRGNAEALEGMGKPAVDYLIHALKDPDKWVRYVAADALGHIGDSCCIEHQNRSSEKKETRMSGLR
ncbi:MAG: HEAT repeat domain-containing protein [Methanomicrobiales archaeon]|nr:HEAT repeat domain-containing protein [Methanomicrobiales archaeon]